MNWFPFRQLQDLEKHNQAVKYTPKSCDPSDTASPTDDVVIIRGLVMIVPACVQFQW